MSSMDKEKWNERYLAAADEGPRPCQALTDFAHLLPEHGTALELASGRGGNALFLARRGLNTSAWDISSIALQQLDEFAGNEGLLIDTLERDVLSQPPEPHSFDVIVVSRFLHRPLCTQIASALRSEGLLFYQTFTHTKSVESSGPTNPDYLLQTNELLQLFSDLQVVAYREESQLGDLSQGLRNEAYLVAQKN